MSESVECSIFKLVCLFVVVVWFTLRFSKFFFCFYFVFLFLSLFSRETENHVHHQPLAQLVRVVHCGRVPREEGLKLELGLNLSLNLKTKIRIVECTFRKLKFEGGLP